MHLIDTSVWAGYFNGEQKYLDEIRALIFNKAVLLICVPVLTEVLQGFKSESGFNAARKALSGLPEMPITINDAVSASNMYRSLRSKGITIRGTIDCLISAAAISYKVQIITSDRDFLPFEKHFELSLKII